MKRLAPPAPASAQVFCIADTHLLPPHPESTRFIPRWLRMLPEQEALALYLRLSRELRRAFETGKEEMRRAAPALVVHLGDVAYGWEKGGMTHPLLAKEARECARELGALGSPFRVCIGNHDTGHARDDNPLFGKGVEICEKTFGQLYWSHETADALHVGIASPLLEYGGENDGKNPALLRKAAEQEAFLSDTLARHPHAPWILYLHRPFGLRAVAPRLRPHLPRLRAVVCGHLHRPALGNVIRTAARLRFPGHHPHESAYAHMMRKTTVCPSIAPLWCSGYGLLSLQMRHRRLRIRQEWLTAPRESDRLSTASLFRCLWAYLTVGEDESPAPGG
ncbi:MAG: metallophosphoesterase [Candidatus Peribacteraceae bacterium]|nr:metallophosphoesterase [Candidatus Peribacteraceae bacterium]